jgi:hypothetical protein
VVPAHDFRHSLCWCEPVFRLALRQSQSGSPYQILLIAAAFSHHRLCCRPTARLPHWQGMGEAPPLAPPSWPPLLRHQPRQVLHQGARPHRHLCQPHCQHRLCHGLARGDGQPGVLEPRLGSRLLLPLPPHHSDAGLWSRRTIQAVARLPRCPDLAIQSRLYRALPSSS